LAASQWLRPRFAVPVNLETRGNIDSAHFVRICRSFPGKARSSEIRLGFILIATNSQLQECQPLELLDGIGL